MDGFATRVDDSQPYSELKMDMGRPLSEDQEQARGTKKGQKQGGEMISPNL